MKIFVLFGSTGDLATRYVLPALGALLAKGNYDHLICVGRRDWTRDDFRTFLAPYPLLLNHTETISYVRLDLESGDFSELKNMITSVGAQNLMPRADDALPLSDLELTYHLCLSPEFFAPVARGIASAGLNTGDAVLMIEKPFGHDLRSAILLNLELQKYFPEDHIYRVDHYLGKNFVREFRDFRLTQGENWYRDRIGEIRIVARESIGIEERGAYYDGSGVTRDILQNHLLQLMALATMQTPWSSDEEAYRDRITQTISDISPLLIDPRHDILMGQYEGYRSTPGVDPLSRTPTYIKTTLTIDNTRWTGVPVILESGKALDRKESSITIVLRDGNMLVWEETGTNKNNAYEYLISQAIMRNSSNFVRWDAIRAAWHVVDDLLHCTDNCPILVKYTAGSEKVG